MSWQGVSNYMEHHLDLRALHCFPYKDMVNTLRSRIVVIGVANAHTLIKFT